jgi:hypothetical protein
MCRVRTPDTTMKCPPFVPARIAGGRFECSPQQFVGKWATTLRNEMTDTMRIRKMDILWLVVIVVVWFLVVRFVLPALGVST